MMIVRSPLKKKVTRMQLTINIHIDTIYIGDNDVNEY